MKVLHLDQGYQNIEKKTQVTLSLQQFQVGGSIFFCLITSNKKSYGCLQKPRQGERAAYLQRTGQV